MTDLRRPVRRVSRGVIREAGKKRQIIIGLEPPSLRRLTNQAKKRGRNETP